VGGGSVGYAMFLSEAEDRWHASGELAVLNLLTQKIGELLV
jgi:hypothetical protein